jgi:hypothetical protein
MGFRFYRRVPLVPGLRLNLSKSGPSLSIGHRGGWFTIGPRGGRATVGPPGTGFYYTKNLHPSHAPHAGHQANFLLGVILIVIIIAALSH